MFLSSSWIAPSSAQLLANCPCAARRTGSARRRPSIARARTIRSRPSAGPRRRHSARAGCGSFPGGVRAPVRRRTAPRGIPAGRRRGQRSDRRARRDRVAAAIDRHADRHEHVGTAERDEPQHQPGEESSIAAKFGGRSRLFRGHSRVARPARANGAPSHHEAPVRRGVATKPTGAARRCQLIQRDMPVSKGADRVRNNPGRGRHRPGRSGSSWPPWPGIPRPSRRGRRRRRTRTPSARRRRLAGEQAEAADVAGGAGGAVEAADAGAARTGLRGLDAPGGSHLEAAGLDARDAGALPARIRAAPPVPVVPPPPMPPRPVGDVPAAPPRPVGGRSGAPPRPAPRWFRWRRRVRSPRRCRWYRRGRCAGSAGGAAASGDARGATRSAASGRAARSGATGAARDAATGRPSAVARVSAATARAAARPAVPGPTNPAAPAVIVDRLIQPGATAAHRERQPQGAGEIGDPSSA